MYKIFKLAYIIFSVDRYTAKSLNHDQIIQQCELCDGNKRALSTNENQMMFNLIDD